MSAAGILTGIVLILVYVVFWLWRFQGRGKLSQGEIDNYTSIVEQLPLPQEEIRAILARPRPWAEADYGKPVYMFNMTRFFDRI